MMMIQDKTVKALRKAKNFRRVSLVKIKAVKEKSYRYDSENGLSSPEDIVKFISPLFKDLDREQLVCINLDNALMPCAIEIIAIGTMSRCPASIGNFFKNALLSNAACIIVVHNHPSGNVDPSDDDVEFTRNLYNAGNILGIDVLDHIILGDDGDFYSFGRSNNDMEDIKTES